MKQSNQWSSWSCPHCDAAMEDPDNIKVTTCANGHTCYLGRPDPKSQHRRAFKSSIERRTAERTEKFMCELMHDAFRVHANRKRSGI